MAIASVDIRDALAVWRRNLVVHLRVWKLNLVAPIIEPVISVLGFGWGIGALVIGRFPGFPYLPSAGPGLLAFPVLLPARFEPPYRSSFRSRCCPYGCRYRREFCRRQNQLT